MRSYIKVHERITVDISFPLKSKPIFHKFHWNNRDYLIKSLELINKANKGEDLIYLFSISTLTGAYKLRFDVNQLSWWLEEIYWEEAR